MAKDEYKGGPAGNRTEKPHSKTGWDTPPRDAGKQSYPKTGGKSDGYGLGRGADRKKGK